MNNRAERQWLHDLWWALAPFWGSRTLLLPIPPQQIDQWLLRYIAGDWSVDGGRNSQLFWLTRDLHDYRGEIQGSAFTLRGPSNLRKIPMAIHGVAEPLDGGSSLRLSIRLAFSRFIWISALSLLILVIFVLRAKTLFQIDVATATPVVWVALGFLLLMWVLITYINLILNLHWQLHLLFKRLRTSADDFRNRGAH